MSLLFTEIPSGLESIRDQFSSILTKFKEAKLPSALDKNGRIKQIFTNTQDNANVYFQMHNERKPRTMADYAKKEKNSLPSVRFSETEIKKIQKKLISDEVSDLTTTEDNLSYQCFHCDPLCDDLASTETNSSHILDTELASCNTLRLQIIRTVEEADKHYSKVHSKGKKSHRQLIPCLKCISQKNYATTFE